MEEAAGRGWVRDIIWYRNGEDGYLSYQVPSATLGWGNTQAIPEIYSLFLTDEKENILVNMREVSSPDRSLFLTELYICPNPTPGKIHIHFDLQTEATVSISIYTLSGELLKLWLTINYFRQAPMI